MDGIPLTEDHEQLAFFRKAKRIYRANRNKF